MASLSLEEIQRSKLAQKLQSPCPSGRAAFPKRAHPWGPKLRRLHCNSQRDIALIHYLLQRGPGDVHYLPGRLTALRTISTRAPRVRLVPAASPPPAGCGAQAGVGGGGEPEQPPSLRMTLSSLRYRLGEERVIEVTAGNEVGVGGKGEVLSPRVLLPLGHLPPTLHPVPFILA